MIIENLRYNILSRGKDKPEKFPKTGDVIEFNVQRKTAEGVGSSINKATLTAEFVSHTLHYSHVAGNARIENTQSLHGFADYETNRVYPLGTIIGELILKRVVNDLI